MSRIQNKWLEHAPAKTVKGNNQSVAGGIVDIPFSDLGELGSNLDSLPWGDPAITPSAIIVKQASGGDDYVESGYVTTGYTEGADQQWVKLTWDQLMALIEGAGTTGESAYVEVGYVETGYVE